MERNKESIDYDYAIRLIKFKVRSLIGEYGFTESDSEDLQQDLLIYLLEHLPQYDSTRATQRTFMDRLLDNEIRTMIKHRRCRKRDCNTKFTSINQTISGDDGDPLSIEDLISYDNCMLHNGLITHTATELGDMRIDVELALSSLPNKLRSLCERLKTQSITEIITETGECRNSVNYKIRRIKKLLGNTGLEKYL